MTPPTPSPEAVARAREIVDTYQRTVRLMRLTERDSLIAFIATALAAAADAARGDEREACAQIVAAIRAIPLPAPPPGEAVSEEEIARVFSFSYLKRSHEKNGWEWKYESPDAMWAALLTVERDVFTEAARAVLRRLRGEGPR